VTLLSLGTISSKTTDINYSPKPCSRVDAMAVPEKNGASISVDAAKKISTQVSFDVFLCFA
jgi:hypothetical protein